MPEKRLVQLRHFHFRFAYDPQQTIILGAETPGSLHTCQESRYEALKVYKPFQLTPHGPGPQSPIVYFNPDSDILCLTYLRGQGSADVWKAFAAQGITFRQIITWDVNFLTTFWKVGDKIDNLDELCVVADRWCKEDLIVGFRDLNDGEFAESLNNASQAHVTGRHQIEDTFRLFEAQDASWKAPILRLGALF